MLIYNDMTIKFEDEDNTEECLEVNTNQGRTIISFVNELGTIYKDDKPHYYRGTISITKNQTKELIDYLIKRL